MAAVDTNYAKTTEELFVGFEGSFGSKHVSPRTLNTRNLGNLVCVEGIVTKCKGVYFPFCYWCSYSFIFLFVLFHWIHCHFFFLSLLFILLIFQPFLLPSYFSYLYIFVIITVLLLNRENQYVGSINVHCYVFQVYLPLLPGEANRPAKLPLIYFQQNS